MPGYGKDLYCRRAKEKIRKAVGMEDAEIFFLAGGTQTNAVVISTMLADYEGVLAAETGHVSTHEAGAIEYTGHEVLTIPQKDGKMEPEDLRRYLQSFFADENHAQMTFPGMVYLSYPTEYGTLYTKQELTEISHICREYDLPLFLDGARLGYGLMSRSQSEPAAFALRRRPLLRRQRLCDVFSIGGTKVGALCGEAVVFTRGNMPKNFMTSVKKRGALLAKGRLLGIQFDALFTDDLYFSISAHAIEMAERLKEIFALGLNRSDFIVLAAGMLIMFVISVIEEKNQIDTPGELLERKSFALRFVLIAVTVLLIAFWGIYGPGYDPADFVYMQF